MTNIRTGQDSSPVPPSFEPHPERMSDLERHHERYIPEDTIRWINLGLTLVHRLRRRTNVKPVIIPHFVSAGIVLIMHGMIPCYACYRHGQR